MFESRFKILSEDLELLLQGAKHFNQKLVVILDHLVGLLVITQFKDAGDTERLVIFDPQANELVIWMLLAHLLLLPFKLERFRQKSLICLREFGRLLTDVAGDYSFLLRIQDPIA